MENFLPIFFFFLVPRLPSSSVMKMNAVLFHVQTGLHSFTYAVIKEASELWTCTPGSDDLSELLFLCGGCLTQ